MTSDATSPPDLLKKLLGSEAFPGILLILVAIAAMLIANSPAAPAYHHLLHDTLAWTPVAKLDTLHLWINDGLMAVFFLVVGLEVKRELLSGQLADARHRRLPVLAAIAGMAAPAAVFLLLSGGEPQIARGWAIPAATDIAFAMGVLGLLGNRVPAALRLFLLTVAIVDDIGAVLIIALFYTAEVRLDWLLAALLIFGGMMALNRMGVRRLWPFVLAAIALWYCMLHSGVHATVAGVVAAFTIPLRITADGAASPLERLEHRLTGWNSYLVIPVFGFANAGVSLAGIGIAGLIAPLPLAIAGGLVIGKQVGIFTAVALAERLGYATRPAGASWLQLWGVSILCGIGFTMSLFIAALAFPLHPMLVEEAKLGILGGSLISALLGYLVLRLAPAPEKAG